LLSKIHKAETMSAIILQ